MGFAELIDYLGTLARNTIRAPFHGEHSFVLYSTPTSLQKEASRLLGLAPRVPGS